MPINIDNTRVTRVRSDSYGNPRYVVHYLALLQCESFRQFEANCSLTYARAVAIAKPAGFKEFNNRSYGGGLVVQSYNIQESLDALQYACGAFVADNTSNLELTDHVLSFIDLSDYECKSLHKIIRTEKRAARLTLAIVQDWLQGLPTACTVEFSNYEQEQICIACGLVGWSSDMYWRYAAKVILAHKS